MKIYYFAQANSRFELEKEIEITPKKLGTQAEHLAYSIEMVSKTLKEFRRYPNINIENLNLNLRNIFTGAMNTHGETKKLLEQNALPNNFDFSEESEKRLAKHFVLDNISEKNEEQRMGLVRPICPVLLEPVEFGIQFANDPNWYEVSAAHQWLVVQGRNESPMTRTPWLIIQNLKKYTYTIDLEKNRLAMRQLREIRETLDNYQYGFGLHVVFNFVPLQAQMNLPNQIPNVAVHAQLPLLNFSLEAVGRYLQNSANSLQNAAQLVSTNPISQTLSFGFSLAATFAMSMASMHPIAEEVSPFNPAINSTLVVLMSLSNTFVSASIKMSYVEENLSAMGRYIGNLFRNGERQNPHQGSFFHNRERQHPLQRGVGMNEHLLDDLEGEVQIRMRNVM